MLTVMRDMAAARRQRARAHARPAPGAGASTPSRTPRSPTSSSARWREGEQSLKRGPELLPILKASGRRRRGRLRRHRGLRRRRRGAARRRGARRSSTTRPARITHPEHASETFRFCTNFAVTGAASSPRRSARPSRRWATRSSSWATRTPSRSTSTPTTPSRRWRCSPGGRGLAAGRRRHARAGPGAHPRSAAARRRPPARRPRRRRTAAASWRATGAGLHELFRSVGAQVLDGGADAQPVDRRAAGRHPRRARRGGRRPAQQPERDHGRRARRRALGEGRLRGASRPRSRRASARRWRSTPTAPRPKRRGDARGARRAAHGRGRARRARRPEGRFTVGEAVGFVDDELVAWGEPEATLRAVLDRLAHDAELITCIAGEGRR